MSAHETITTVDGHELAVVEINGMRFAEGVQRDGLEVRYEWVDGELSCADDEFPWTLTGDFAFLAHPDPDAAADECNHEWSERAVSIARRAGIRALNDSEFSQTFLYLRSLEDARRLMDLLAATRTTRDAWLVPVTVAGCDSVVAVAVREGTFEEACCVAARLTVSADD